MFIVIYCFKKCRRKKMSCDGCPIASKSSARYLGVVLDSKFTFNVHIKSIQRKVACVVGVIAKLKSYFPKRILLKLYHALLHFHLIYALPVWGATYKTYLQKLVSAQNKALKIIAGAQLNDSVGPIYQELNILSFHKLYQFKVAKITHSVCTKNFPHNLSQYYEKYGSSHSYSSRRSSSLMLAIPQVKTSKLFGIKVLKFGILSLLASNCRHASNLKVYTKIFYYTSS